METDSNEFSALFQCHCKRDSREESFDYSSLDEDFYKSYLFFSVSFLVFFDFERPLIGQLVGYFAIWMSSNK